MGNIYHLSNFNRGQLWLPCTEEDSPYYKMDYSKLSAGQKAEHDKYVQGLVSKINPKFRMEFIKERHKETAILRNNLLKNILTN